VDPKANHVVIVGGPEAKDELLAIVLDGSDEAIPLFDSVEEADEFLASIGEYGEDWHARELSAGELIELLEYQGEEVEYVALSPPPENLEGGMQVQLLYREILTDLLRRQIDERPPAERPPSERRGLWRRLFGR
jgi:hypothetical protein